MYACVGVSLLHYNTSPIGFDAVLTVWYFVFILLSIHHNKHILLSIHYNKHILLSIHYNKHILFTGTVTIIIDDETGARFGDFGKSNTGYMKT